MLVEIFMFSSAFGRFQSVNGVDGVKNSETDIPGVFGVSNRVLLDGQGVFEILDTWDNSCSRSCRESSAIDAQSFNGQF
jgi:hypothetical protein